MDKKWQLAAILTLILSLGAGVLLIWLVGPAQITGTQAGESIGGFGVALALILYMAGNSDL